MGVPRRGSVRGSGAVAWVTSAPRLAGPWVVWMLLVLLEGCVRGIPRMRNHMGPGSRMAGIWFGAGLSRVWPWAPLGAMWRLLPWLRAGLAVAMVALIMNGLAALPIPRRLLSADANRYVGEVDREFERDRVADVLLNAGTRVYDPSGAVMRDRAPAIGEQASSETGDFPGTLGRLREKWTLAFSTYLGGARGYGTLREVAFDAAGNMLVTGYGSEYTLRNFPGARIIGPTRGESIPVVKLTPEGRLLWMTLIGGSGKDRAYGIAVDAADHIYIAGQTGSLDFPTTPGAWDRTNNGGGRDCLSSHGCNLDGFVLKLTADGSRLSYSTYLGGSGEDGARGGVAIDQQGSAYVVGFTESPDFLNKKGVSNPAKVNAHLGGVDAFVTKVSPNGSAIVYSRYLGGSNDRSSPEGRAALSAEVAIGIQMDAGGHAFVSAAVRSRDAFTTSNAVSRTFRGGISDAYLTKLSPDGKQVLYATYLGGSREEFPEHRLALDAAGNVYLVGQTGSDDFPTVNADQPKRGGEADGYLLKLDSLGRLVFATFIGGSREEDALGPFLDRDGNIFVTGLTRSPDFPVTRDAIGKTFRGVADAFLRIYGPDGRLIYSTFLGGSGFDFGRYVAVDAMGDAIVVGETESLDFPTTPGAYSRLSAGDRDGFVMKLKAQGTRVGR